MDVLKEAGELRSENGMICAVAGYPASDCGGEVKEVSAEAAAADTPIEIAAPAAATSATDAQAASPASAETQDDGSSVAYVIAGVALLALIAFLLVRARSRSRDSA
ncbi:MAG: hypothetical protein LOY01_15560 [Brachybacterium paraconglomeratum]|nr:hypothetical protein [Brachybacterium paraconglomeratum]